MPSSKPTIVPLAIAHIQAHGSQTADSISKAVGYSIWSVRKALMNAADLGQLSVVRESSPGGGFQNRYSLVKAIEYPKLSAGEWQGYAPTGTAPESITRITEAT